MKVIFAYIHKYKILEDVMVNIDSAFIYSMKPNGIIEKTPKKNPRNLFGENISMHCVIGKNGSGKSLLMNLLLGGETSLNEGECYHLLYEENGTYFLHSIDNKKEEIFLYKENSLGIISFVAKLKNKTDSPPHLTYYMSSNNINMLKSWRSDKKNDWSIGNDNRFRKLHNTYEANLYNLLKKSKTTLTKDLLNRNVHFKVDFQWLRSYGKQEFEQRTLIKDVRRMVAKGDYITIFCHFIMRIIEKSFTINEILNFHEDDLKKICRDKKTFSIVAYCLNHLNIRNNFQITNTHFKYVENFLKQFKEKVTFTDNHFELISNERDDSLFDLIIQLTMDYEIHSPLYRFYIEPPFSTGQWKRVELASKMNLLMKDHHGVVINLLLDEPDADLHPELQTELVSWITQELSESDNQYNIILSTHNPLILSDFPSENITSLDKGLTNGVSKTFGANIYDLYKNTFMIDHAMGKFASNKIRDALVSDEPNIELLKFLQQEIADLLILHEINKVIHVSKNHNRVNDILNSLTAEEVVALRMRILNNDN